MASAELAGRHRNERRIVERERGGRPREAVDRRHLAEQLPRLLVTDRDLAAVTRREDELHAAVQNSVDIAGRVALEEDDVTLAEVTRAPELAERVPQLGRRRRDGFRHHAGTRDGRSPWDPHPIRARARSG